MPRRALAAPWSTVTRPFAGLSVQQPQFVGAKAQVPGAETRAHLVAANAGHEDVGPGSPGDHRLDPSTRGDARRLDLAPHAAAAQRAARIDVDLVEHGEIPHLTDVLRLRIGSRVRRVQAVGVGQQDQQIGLDQEGHLRGQVVVVADAEFVGRGRVVLVDDGHDPPLQQPVERVASVEILGAGTDVERGEQHLGGDHLLVGEELTVGVVEVALTNGRCRLQIDDLGRPRSAGGATPCPTTPLPRRPGACDGPAAAVRRSRPPARPCARDGTCPARR